ncbi:MAG TPA: GtrA family protein [Anaerolinea sp.]|nr:GtrA family protein [Anaerolinea sp.]
MNRIPVMIRQAFKFGLVGVLNTAVDWLVYFALTHGLAYFGANLTFAKGISYTVGVLNSFFWNKTWTFRSSAAPRSTLLPFFITNLVGLAINTGLMQVCLHTLRLPEIVSLIVATLGTLAWNFTLSKLVVFKT